MRKISLNVLLPLFGLFVLILYSNWHGVITYQSLYLDDLARYGLAKENILHSGILERHFLRAYIMQLAYELLTIDLRLGRLYIVFWLVFACFLTYKLFSALGLNRWASWVSALVPAALIPKQTQIPSFVDGSYVVPGLCIALLSLLLIVRFIRSARIIEAASAILLFLATLEMMDQVIFLAPAFVFLIIFHKPLDEIGASKNIKLKERLILSFTLMSMATWKMAMILFTSVESYVKPKNLTFEVIQERLTRSLEYIAPITYESNVFTTIFVSSLVCIALVLVIIYVTKWRYGVSHKIFQLIIFSLIWLMCSSVVFWVSSPYFAPRYFYVSSIGFAAILGVSLHFLLEKCRHVAVKAIVAVLVLVWGSYTVQEKRNINARWIKTANLGHFKVVDSIKKLEKFPDQLQIAVDGYTNIPTGGYWSYSSSYLKIALGREDVKGFVGNKRLQFYNAFIPSQRAYTSQMTGLDRNEPTFIFNIDKDGSSRQMKYALIWYASKWIKAIPGYLNLGASDTNSLLESHWELVKLDSNTGEVSTFRTGDGLASYYDSVESLKAAGILENEIAWAGPLTRKTRDRFGLR